MPTTCDFELDRLNPIYTSGEYINGRILLKTEKVKRVNGKFFKHNAHRHNPNIPLLPLIRVLHHALHSDGLIT